MSNALDRDLQRYVAISAELIQREQWDQLRELMAEAIEIFPENPELCLRYAVALVPTAHDDAVKYARRAAGASVDDPYRLTRCASLLYDLGEIEDAGEYVRLLLPLIDNAFPLIADVFYLIGMLAVAKANDPVAEEYLRLAFTVEPAGRSHGYQLARFLATRDMANEALDVIAEALEHASPDREALLGLRSSLTSEET